jgi:archaemetzincin
MVKKLLPVALALAMCATGSLAASPRPVVAIQPFGDLDEAVVRQVQAGIAGRFDVEVVVLPGRELPAAAYYRPRDRYRAERLLDALERDAAGRYAKVVGLTSRDISTSTERHEDWGVYGLGALDGVPCVVSTYRLERGEVSGRVVEERLVKAVNHELGHTFGIDHCPTSGCLMSDAAGTIRTVDAGDGRFCATCSARLDGVARVEHARPLM